MNRPTDLCDEIKRKGTRGGTHVTDTWLRYILQVIAENPTWVNRETFSAIDHLVTCQQKADAYDGCEYVEQMQKIQVLRDALQRATADAYCR